MSKWAPGSRKTAALLAAWTMTAGNSALDRRGDLAEARELLVEEIGVGFVGGREVGPDPGQLQVRALGAGAGQREDRLGVAVAEPAHAAVVLDVDPGGPPLGAGAGGDQREEVLVPGGDLRAGRERESRSSSVSAPIVSSGTCGRRRPISAASAPVATASRVAPPASAALAQASAPWP